MYLFILKKINEKYLTKTRNKMYQLINIEKLMSMIYLTSDLEKFIMTNLLKKILGWVQEGVNWTFKDFCKIWKLIIEIMKVLC